MAQAQNQSQKKVKPISNTSYVIDFRENPIAKGSFGQIRRVYDLENTQKKLCCKIISIKDFKNLQSALNELRIIEQLPQNKNLVSFEKIKFNTQEDMYFIMEYCEGGNLQDYIYNNDYLSEIEIQDFLYQFVSGYADLHSHNILHRDLKPENILIHKKQYKIADFGLSTILEFKNQKVEGLGNLLTRAPELYPMHLRDQMFKDNKDYSKIDMFSLGVILYNLAYKEDSHPYVGTIRSLFGNNFQGDQSIHFCKSVNASKQIVFPPFPPRSEQLQNIIKKLCQKDVNQRMSFDELIQCDYIFDIKPVQENESQLNIFDSKIQSESDSILKLTQRQSYRQTIYPQPEIRLISQFFYEMDLQNNLNQSDIQNSSKSKILFDENDDLNQTSIKIMSEIEEQELQKQLDQIEEENRRNDKQNEETFAIFDKCLYLRQIVFFFDKVQLHLDAFIKMLEKKIKPLKKIQNIDLYIKIFQDLRITCALESNNRNETIYMQLENYYPKSSIYNFKLTPECVKFEQLRCQDEYQLITIIKQIQQQNQQNIKLTENLTLKAFYTFQEIFELFENLDEQQYKFEKKQTLINYWYIYQINRFLNCLSFFCNSPSFEKNTNKFHQYYELIDHYLTIDELRYKILEAVQLFNIHCIINID
ncbi:Serine/Threonine kinase domain protein (macronuclear) [Tetrahymena thermophila SB210]|uniref:Serine/Threonine kinase domain protein n=1 Tax=Tetrahymena thermophila (strain SB210) TaxID=312017 RepID=I7M6V5_TETTS|nr:Serine/Threonine kinase domain protein [Tetrahymena thermophila SB210]EAR87334.3 Serine/Threonine kinase domain protein [Tetrahymena thermophila SB210]|eukprot:XP_001007579.3 Serine/Threonine kinase domain protein [Tetrahymena thermophila SB210]